MNIAGVEIGPAAPCRFVAEIGPNHNGSLLLACRLIDAAREIGADFVKFQLYTVDEMLVLRGDGLAPEPWHRLTLRELYGQAITPATWLPALAEHCQHRGIPWFASVFGADSLAILEAAHCPAYKLAALDFGKRELREMVQATGKPVIRSCPMSMAPPGEALHLYCPPGYPQRAYHLRALRHGYDGFSYHGTEIDPPLVAVAHGASVIEAHLMLDDEPADLDAGISLTEYQFSEMIQDARQIETVLD